MKKLDKETSYKITYMNCAMAIAIVLYHWKYSLFFAGNAEEKSIKLIYNLFDLGGSIAVGYFFTISGFLLYYGMNSREDMIRKLKKRASTLLIPFITWNVLAWIWQKVFLNPDVVFTIKDIIAGLTYKPFDGVLWYVFTLILLTLFVPVIYKCKNNRKTIIVFAITAVVGAIVGWEVTAQNSDLWWFTRMFGYLPNYCVGAAVGMYISAVQSKKSKICIPAIRAGATLYVVIFTIYYCITERTTEPNLMERMLIMLLPFMLWIAIADEKFRKQPSWPVTISFFLYVTHSIFLIPVFDRIEKLLGGVYWDNTVVVLIYFLFKVLLLYGTALLLCYILKKILPDRVYKILSGGRG